MPAKDIIGKTEVAQRLNISVKTVSNWMKRRILPYYKPAHTVLFRWSEVLAHWEANYLHSPRQIWGQATFPLTKHLSAFPPVKSGVALHPRRKVSNSRRGSESRRQ